MKDQVNKFLNGQVVQVVNTYMPTELKLPKITFCFSHTNMINALTERRLPANLFIENKPSFDPVVLAPFPDLNTTWQDVNFVSRPDMANVSWIFEGDGVNGKPEVKTNLINTGYFGVCRQWEMTRIETMLIIIACV